MSYILTDANGTSVLDFNMPNLVLNKVLKVNT